MDARGRTVATTRLLGTVVVVVGLLITIVGLMTDSTPGKGYVFAGMLVFVGIGLRLEAALIEHR